MSTTRQNAFHTLGLTHPTSGFPISLHRLKTAFSPSRRHSFRSTSPSSTIDTTSSLTRTASPDAHASPSSSFRSRSSTHSHSGLWQVLLLRRKPSMLDLEMEEERCLFATELEVLEPRPGSAERRVEMGIEEVLGGRW